jgi:hypothetical protein
MLPLLPVTVTEALPLLALHVDGVDEAVATKGTDGCVILPEPICEHPLPSVTVTVTVPALKSDIVEVVLPLLHK